MNAVRKLIILTLLICLAPAWAQVSYEETHSIIHSFYEEYSAELEKQSAALIINPAPNANQPDFWWNLDNAHASYSTTTSASGIRQHLLFIFGGFAKMRGMTSDSLVKTICHEVGHGIGGAPFKKKQQKELVSTEGQSDYFATSTCLRRMFQRLPKAAVPPSSFVERTCQERFTQESELNYCYRAFSALEVDILMFKQNHQTETSFELKDPTIVNDVNLTETFYPTPQCRLDTLVAGVLQLERPRCWWAD